jgi:membrane protein insertase Oxa1/YidC/SpoIIIJ
MLAMIIFMGFSLASGMGIYWLFGALFSVAQTLIMQVINDKKAKKAKYGGRESVSAKRKGK